MDFGSTLYKKRIEKHLTQQELADAIFVTRQTVSRWEKGHNYPTLDTLVEICQVLDVDIQDMFPQSTPAPDSPDVFIVFKIIIFLIGLLITGLPFLILLIFAKINKIDAINRYNPFLTNT